MSGTEASLWAKPITDMPPDVAWLIDHPQLAVPALLAGALAGVFFERLRSRLRRRASRARYRRRWQRQRATSHRVRDLWTSETVLGAPRQPDAADQLRIVMNASFAIQPLLNRSEARLFQELDRLVLACNPQWHVMAQVSLGEILRSQDAKAYGCVNAKRVDLLLVDDQCQPRHAVEYQGAGHHQTTAAARDAVKKEALRRAGIGYHEVIAGQTTPSDLRRLVERLVDKPAG